jgi:hypothetical protein
MINSEKIFDMLPVVVELYDKLDLDTFRKKLAEENKLKKLDENDLGIEIFKHILKNSAKVKENFFEIVAIFEDKTIEEAKAQSFAKTISTIKEVFMDKEMTGFFKQAIQ